MKLQSDTREHNSSLHVLFTGFVFKDVITGGDQLFLDIAPRLPKDLNITVITPHFALKYWQNIDQGNITFKVLPKNRFEYNGNPVAIFLSYVIRSVQTYRILKNETIQTIYSCSDIAYADIWPAYLIRRRQPKIKWLSRVYHILLPPGERQGNKIANAVAFYLQRLSFWMMKRQSTTIFPLNKKLQEEMINLGFPKNKMSILGAGIDFNTINSHKVSKQYNYDVVALGRLTPVKGIYDTVKVWSIVHKKYPHLKLAWIGGGDEAIKKKVERQLKDARIENTFDLLGFIDKSEVYNILHTSKVFLCPDHENGWGLAVCEAMASGLPVVSYDLDIFGSVYQKGYVKAPLYDTDVYARELIRILDNETLRKKVANQASDQARKFDHNQVIKKLVHYI